MKCSSCGQEHDVLDPTFRRPDAVHQFPAAQRPGNVMEGDDLCAIRAQDASQVDRYFVRCTLAVPLLDHGDQTVHWGLWAEVDGLDSKRIYDLWDDPDQAAQPAIDARLANNIPGYPATIGLPLRLKMTGPRTRPALVFRAQALHPFAAECRAGVAIDRVFEWLARMGVGRN